MGYITRKRPSTEQPRQLVELENPKFWRLVDVQDRQTQGSVAVTRTLVNTASLGRGQSGSCANFIASGDCIRYGADPNLQLSTMTGIAVIEVPNGANSVIFNTNAGGVGSQGFILRVNQWTQVQISKLDAVDLFATARGVKTGGAVSTVVWSYNNVTGLLRVVIDGILESTTYAETFIHGTVARNEYYAGSTTFSSVHKQYLFALSASDAVSNAQLIEWSRNPWSIFKASARRVWASASASSEGVGTSSGASTVSGIGASTANSIAASSGVATVSGVGAAVIGAVGSASGVATVSGVGTSGTGSTGSAAGTSTANGASASLAASDGLANGVASVSGVGASIVASDGSASGSSTVSGVGDSAQAGSAVGSASGTSTATGVSASIIAAVGTASGDCSVNGVGVKTGGEVESFSGGYLYDDTRESRAERTRKQRIKLGIIEEEKPGLVPPLELFEISNLVEKKPGLVPTKKQLIPARQLKKLAEQEALNAELKMLLQLETEREEETILRFLMEL